MDYSRTHPSPRYIELTEQYRQMHREGERFLGLPADQTFPGLSLPPQAARIKRMISLTKAANILDYGCGKGKQYDLRKIDFGPDGVWESIQDYWDVDFVHCYDPSYAPFSTLPSRKFDGVICTDVLEHCPEEDIPWIVAEIFGYADRFVFANVASYPASKRLPTGENAHCTVRPAEWWKEIVDRIAALHPDIAWEIWVESWVRGPEGAKRLDIRLGSDRSAD